MTERHGSMAAHGTQRRHATRRKMFEPVTLGFGGAEVRAHFLDLSCSGALAHCETPPAPGNYVNVGAPGFEMSGRVMWARGKRFGIQFSQPLTQAQTDALIAGA